MEWSDPPAFPSECVLGGLHLGAMRLVYERGIGFGRVFEIKQCSVCRKRTWRSRAVR